MVVMDFSRGKDFLEVPTQIDRPQPGKTHFIAPPTLSLSHSHSSDCWTQAQQQNVQLVFELPETEACVHGDPGLLHRAVINLLTNAIKYGKPQDSDQAAIVECSIVEDAQSWGIAVRDHGPGMDEASLTTLSQPFERLRQHERMDGVGLGLAFTRTVAQRHGGNLQISSSLGDGSTFTLHIPKA